MKYILVIGDGMADHPLDTLGGRTPLEASKKDAIDALARHGILGSVRNVPEGFAPGSDTAIMSIFGCTPRKYFFGRAPLEAAASGIQLAPGDACYRCNMVTYADEDAPFEHKHILSHSAGSIEGRESDELVTMLFNHPDFRPLAEQAGSAKAVNVVLVGVLSRSMDIPEENWLRAIEETVPPKFVELNRRAFLLGREVQA